MHQFSPTEIKDIFCTNVFYILRLIFVNINGVFPGVKGAQKTQNLQLLTRTNLYSAYGSMAYKEIILFYFHMFEIIILYIFVIFCDLSTL
jgi:hypothetical protein